MQWTPGGTSGDIEDRRDSSGFGGGGFGGRHIGIGGLLLLMLLSVIFKQDLVSLFSGAGPAPEPRTGAANRAMDEAEKPEVQFISFVLDDVQNTWDKIFTENGKQYRHTKLVLYRDATQSGCGGAQSETGPFYCPQDEKVYLDLGFYDELKNRFGAPGEFAQAYVLAHEIGHHVQKQLGVEQRVSHLQQTHPGARNELSVALELQADCLAGVWAHSTQQRNIIDQGDIQAGMQAAAAVGDDRLQKMATGRVAPDSFTHGSSAQRTEWFERGLKEGNIGACDTSSATSTTE
jgi:predicted metalloprotease